MNLNQREHRYGDLREVVIDVMLEVGDQGLENFERLLEKSALELDKRDGLASGLAPILERLADRDPSFEAMKAGLAPFARPAAAEAILSDLEKLVA